MDEAPLTGRDLAKIADPKRRRRAVREMVEHHLDQGGGQVCTRPITSGIYRVFLDDMAARGEHRPPDGPDVTGVWRGDAAAFVEWVNDLVGEARYRLPTRDELDESGLAVHHVWLDQADESERQPLWRPPGSPHPHEIGASALRRYLALDFEHPAATFAPFLLSWAKARGDGLAGSLRWAADLAGDLAPDLARAREHALALATASNLAEARAYAGTLARTLDAAAARYRDLDEARDFDNALAPEQDRPDVADAEANLSRILGRAPGRAEVMARAIELEGDGTVEVRALLEQILAPGEVTGTLCVISKILWEDPYPASRVVDRIATTVAAAIKADQTPRLDLLADLVREGTRGFDAPDPDFSRGRRVATRLEAVAVPVLERRKPFTADRAAAIRIIALCLALEADTLTSAVDPATGDAYREVAAGVTLLEQRHNGSVTPAEIIVLARATHPAPSPRRKILRLRPGRGGGAI